jgi:hypothetical protein
LNPSSERTRRWLLGKCLAAIVATSLAIAPAAAESPSNPGTVRTNPAVKQIGPGSFEIGQVRFNQKERSVSFPALVNFREGPVEYLVVNTKGKIHESVFRTDCEPHDIHMAMLLLGAKGAGTNAFAEDVRKALPGETVSIAVSWEKNGKQSRRFAEEFVRDRKADRVMTKGAWVYNGSRFREDGFGAQQDGSIVSLITDPDALVNNPRPGREDDDNWLANAKTLPPLETAVVVTLRLKR